jgi:tetratricopeptide (TPR) repeat protein
VPEERELFERLAIFVGGCTAPSAAAVCGATRSSLASLVAKSLLQERLGADGEPRYAMLETVRLYALERHAETGESDALARRHAEHYATLAESAEDATGATGHQAWSRLDEEQGNLRSALDWSSAAGEVELECRLVGALAYFWVIRDQLSEARSRLEGALSRGRRAPAALRAKVLFGAARFANSLGDDERMRELMEESLAVYRSLGDRTGVARSLDGLGIAVSNLGDLSRGIELNQQSAAIYRELGDDRGLAITLNNLGSLCLSLGEHERATLALEEALAVFERLGLRDRMPIALGNLGLAALLRGRPQDALASLRRSVEVALELDYTEGLIYGLEGIAAALTATGAFERAATFIGAADAAAEATSVVLEPLERGIHDETRQTLLGALGEDAFAAIEAAGRQLPLTDAATAALSASRTGA